MKKQKVLIGLLSLLLVLSLVFTSCVKKKNPDAPSPEEQMQTRIASLETKVAGHAETISGLKAPPNLQPEIDKLKAELIATNTKVTELETKVKEYNSIAEEEEAAASDDTVRWSFSTPRIVYPTAVSSNITVIVDNIDPHRIEEEGLYEVELLVINQSDHIPWSMRDVELKLILEPRDYSPINEVDTYLDSDDHPWLSWDADFVMKTREGEEVCRRIEFTSDRYDFNYTLNPNNTLRLKLVLELYYN